MSYLKFNKLIAEYMGKKVFSNGISKYFYYTVPRFENGRLSHSANTETVMDIANLYNTCWDWLIPVISKIYKSEEYKIYESVIVINPDSILLTYDQVVDFIVWYEAEKIAKIL